MTTGTSARDREPAPGPGADGAGSVVSWDRRILGRLIEGFGNWERIAPDVERNVRAIREAVERPRTAPSTDGEETSPCRA